MLFERKVKEPRVAHLSRISLSFSFSSLNFVRMPASTHADSSIQPPNAKRKKLDDSQALLPFQRDLLTELIPSEDASPTSTDGMVIMARGLGLRSVVTTFVRSSFEEVQVGVSSGVSVWFVEGPLSFSLFSSRSMTCQRSWCSSSTQPRMKRGDSPKKWE